MKRTTINVVVSTLFLISCSNNTKEAKVIQKSPESTQKISTEKVQTKEQSKIATQKVENSEKISNPQADSKRANSTSQENKTKEMPKDPVHNAFKKNSPEITSELAKFYTIFNDGAQIAPKNGKPLLLVFGQPTDPYTQKLQNDVVDNPELSKLITDNTTPIYINAVAKKMHKFMHNGDLMDVDTKTLVGIYHLEATPTLIFMDEKSQSIFMVPGYMPPKQFKVTLQFVKDGVWKGKDRKNGEIYKALKDYYIKHGIKVGEPKK